MATARVNLDEIVSTSSFGKDNYARRLLRKTAATVDVHADEIDRLANILAPMELIGTYKVEVGDSFPDDGIGWEDVTAVVGRSLEGARGIAFEILGVSVGTTTTHGNKNISISVLDPEDHVLTQADDGNAQVSYEYFKLTTAISGEVYAEISGRAPDSTTASQKVGFSKKIVGLQDGTVIPATPVQIGDFNISFGTNKLTQNRDIVINVYAQF